MANPQEGIRFEIFDQEYSVKGDLDPQYLGELAKYLDGKMRSIAARSRNVDSLRVAVLAALNIADEYHQLKARFEATTKEVEQKVIECNQALDQLFKRAV